MAGQGKHKMPKATRLLALVAAAVVAAGIALLTGSASAHDNWAKSNNGNRNVSASGSAQPSADPAKDKEKDKPAGHDHSSEQQQPPPSTAGNGKPNNGLDVLGRDCANSKLQAHDGFQRAPRCVSTAFGEVSAAAQNPSLLITDAPRVVRAGQGFQIKVSTRNLVRDRFLGAAAGGYYLESSFLNDQGLQRGHFHTACRMLASTDVAPDPAPVPAAFVATQDGKGGATPDTVTVEIPSLPTRGIAQCAAWAGDGSHRIPMMERANETPAFDAVRIIVR